jgi:hypothetical protein
MSEYNVRKRSEAVAYLKSRGKHLLSTNFVPTDSAHTSVKETMARYVEETKRENTSG